MEYLKRINPNGYLERLHSLIEERLDSGVDKDAVDARIWDVFGETRSILFTDLSGFSRRVAEFGIIHFLQVIHESRIIFEPCIDAYDGILIRMEGDSMLVVFRRPSKAVGCAIAMQRAASAYNVDRSDAEKILVCVGIGWGRILSIGDTDVFGAEVNAASKLGEDTAKAWEILVTESVAVEVADFPGIAFEKIDYVPPGAKAAFKVLYSL